MVLTILNFWGIGRNDMEYFANQILNMIEENKRLKSENIRLKDIEIKFDEFVQSAIAHQHKMANNMVILACGNKE